METQVKCNYCETEFAIERNQTEVVCPNCGRKFKIGRDNENEPFLMDDAMYQSNVALKKKDKGCGRLVIFVILTILMAVGVQLYFKLTLSPIAKTEAYADSKRLITEFRTKNPYNFQTVAIKTYDDKSHVIIISEPSEKVTYNGLKRILNKYNYDLVMYDSNIGLDGKLRDAVICINGLNKLNFNRLKSKLFKYIYKTDYKAEYLPLDSIVPSHVDFSSHNLNYQVSYAELVQWFLRDGEELLDVDNMRSRGLFLDVIKSGFCGVYYTKTPGFVVWVLERDAKNMEMFGIDARKFSLDSDLVLGAISTYKNVAIIGRERSVPVYELPPMRVETLIMLASTNKTELAQSYERANVFAGKLPGGKDFAPIYLSDELWHTELGGILNVTDQMLKSWSQNGYVEYENFKMEKPIDWAFEKPLSRDLGVRTLTFNWNTAGVGYEVQSFANHYGYTVYALNRTGSLPISYIVGDDSDDDKNKLYLAEDKAYDFFSGLSNPELVKVVQYMSMYQIFKNYNIKVNKSDSYDKVSTNLVENEMYYILKDLCHSDIDKDRKKLDGYLKNNNYYLDERMMDIESCLSNFESIRNFLSEYDCPENKYEYPDIMTIARFFVNFRDIDSYYSDEIHELNMRLGTLRYKHLIGQTNRSRDLSFLIKGDAKKKVDDSEYEILKITKTYKICKAYEYLISHTEDLQLYAELCGVSKDKIKNLYLDENKGIRKQWIKCPTLVLSWDMIDSVNVIGGHNLNSSITHFVVDNKLSQNQYRIANTNNGKYVYVSSKDKNNITSEFLTDVKRKNADGEYTIKKQIATPVRPRTQVMHPAMVRTERGFNAQDHVVCKVNDVYKVNGKEIKDTDMLLEELANIIYNEGQSPCKNIRFENISETTVRAIFDNEKSYVMEKGRISKMPKECFDISMISYETKGDYTVAKILVKPEYAARNEASVSIEVPTSKLEAFKKALMDFFKNPTKYWNDFMLRFELKKNLIFEDEYKLYRELQIAHVFDSRNCFVIDRSFTVQVA